MPRRLKLFASRPLTSYLSDTDDNDDPVPVPHTPLRPCKSILPVASPLPPILCVPEVLQFIARELDSVTLSSLARSRRALWDVASQQLYQTLDSKQLEKLAVRLLAYMPAPDPGANARLERFRQNYAHHIQHLSIAPAPASTVNSISTSVQPAEPTSIWRLVQRLLLISPLDPVLPHLRSLRCSIEDPSNLETLLPLLVTSLEELFVQASPLPLLPEREWNVPVSFLISALPERTPLLRKLALNVQTTSLDHAPAFQRTFAELTRLQLIECDYIAYHPSVFLRLAKLKQLKKLRIGWSAEYLWPEFGAPLPLNGTGEYWSHLRSLTLDGACSVLLPALNSVVCHLLELDLGITLTKADDRAALPPLAAYIHSTYPNLTYLHCRISDSLSSRSSIDTHQGAVFSSFLKCAQLEVFGFSYSSPHAEKDLPLHFGNDDVLAMARAWPGLRELTLDCPLANPSALTVDCLGDLAVHCKLLEKLELPPLCADYVPRPAAPAAAPDRVLQLSLKLSSFENASYVALYISALWPNIKFDHSCSYCVQVKNLHEMMSYRLVWERCELGKVKPAMVEHLSARWREPFVVM